MEYRFLGKSGFKVPALGFGAAALSPWLRRPAVWRAIDAVIAVVMALVAAQLVFSS